MFWIIPSLVSMFVVDAVLGHGMMLVPPNRGSMWRTHPLARINYNDNENFCGGFNVQYFLNGGRCGVCGDGYNDPQPQNNANTGIFGQGVIAGTYRAGSVIDVHILLTANHEGSFNYSLCVLEDPNEPEQEECFVALKLENGLAESPVHDPLEMKFVDKVQLPENVTCDRCVLRWTYRAGNNWGFCEDGENRPGCGPQEHFRNCADIKIVA